MTGDIVAHHKTELDYENEELAFIKVVSEIPSSLQEKVLSLRQEFKEQKSIESKFVRAIDKMEPIIHSFSESGKEIVHRNKFTRNHRDRYVGNSYESFKFLQRFEDV